MPGGRFPGDDTRHFPPTCSHRKYSSRPPRAVHFIKVITPRLHSLLIALHWGFTLEREIFSSVGDVCAIFALMERFQRGLLAYVPAKTYTSAPYTCTVRVNLLRQSPLILARPPRLSILTFLFIHRIFFSLPLFNPLEIFLSKIPFCLHLLSSLQHSPSPPRPPAPWSPWPWKPNVCTRHHGLFF